MKSLGKELGLPVVLEEDHVMPRGDRAKIRVVKKGERYGAVLRYARSAYPIAGADHATELAALEAGKKWLTSPIAWGKK
jgi:hypothetical protein